MATSIDNLKSVEEKIRYIVEEQWKPDADYMFFNWAQANIALDGMTRPAIVYILPVSGALYTQWHQTCDRPTTHIAFLAKTDFDFNTHTNDALMQKMKELAVGLVQQIGKSGLFEKIPQKTEIQYQAVYDHLDENVTGIIISLELQEVKGIQHCTTA